MKKAPVLIDEEGRLRALHRLKILDTPPEERFDRITRTATRLFRVPISTLTLVNTNREWYKSVCGLEKREGSRAISFCGHVLESDELLVIPDTLKDVRFRDNPMVIGKPYIRFYAGLALRSLDGYRVGTLCLKDTRPRRFDDADFKAFKDLADWAESEMNQRELLNQIRKDQSQLDALLQNIGEGVIAIDKTGGVMFMNARAEQSLGFTVREAKGKLFTDLWKEENEEGEITASKDRAISLALTTGKQQVLRKGYYYLHRDGSRFPVLITATPIHLKKTLIGAVVVFRDVTEDQRIDRAKNEFISLASHQLLTPLSTIKWYAERLLSEADGSLNTRQKGLGAEMQQSNQRLIDIVGALLHISRIEMGKVAFAPVSIDVEGELKHIVQGLKPMIDQKKAHVALTISDLPPNVMVDPLVFRLSTENVITNAVKYTPVEGHVWISAAMKGKKLLISVKDDGMGIPKDQQEKMFTKFFRATNARLAAPNGNGLGLYIVKTFVEAVKGKVWFTSEEKKGSTFFVELPITLKKEKRKVD